VVPLLLATLTVPLVGGPIAAAASLNLRDAELPDPVSVSGVTGGEQLDWVDETEQAASGRGATAWPKPGLARGELKQAGQELVAGTLPVTIAGGEGPGTVQVQVVDQAKARAAGVDGVLLAVRGLEGEGGDVDLEIDYSAFAEGYGGGWASRLTLRAVPSCALTSPDAERCAPGAPLETAENDLASQRVSATVAVEVAEDHTEAKRTPVAAEPQLRGALMATPNTTLLALTAASAAGASGDFGATDLAPSGSWNHGGSSGGFSWSYPLEVPQVPGGLAPHLGLSYSSQAVDGRTAATNNQANWIGDGWSMSPGFIERRYISCEADKEGGNNPAHKVGDLCWKKDNATLSLDGSSDVLVKDDDSGVWRKQNDDGTRVELLKSSARDNGDNDGEYWRVTTPGGTQYHFGYHKLPGWSTGNPVTNSTWTVPVYGNHTDEPCRATSFADSWCQQAWRWNLDYVVDPHGNAMAYHWEKETNRYARAINSSYVGTPTAYTRGGNLKSVEYGLRSDTIFTAKAAGRIVFGMSERCLPKTGVTCDWSTVTEASAANWPDVPFDRYCKSGDSCEGKSSPSYWTTKRLTTITSYALNSGVHQKADSWTLAHSFPSTGDGSEPALWLKSIVRTGHTGDNDLTLPAVTFRGLQLPNRVEGVVDPVPPLNRYRVYAIDTETGGTIGVTYSQPDCAPGNMPAPATNTRRCYPVIWSPPDAPAPDYEPYLDWFHSYVVDQVLEADNTAGAPVIRTDYQYLGGLAWAKSEDDFTEAEYRTYGDRKGYGRVRALVGDPTEGPQTLSESRYFRGIAGAAVADSEGNALTDHEAFAGMIRETISYDSPGGAILSASTTTPWRSTATASHARDGVADLHAYQTGTKTEETRGKTASGSWRRTKVTRTFDAYGMVKDETDHGNTAVSGDETCTTISYARNTDKNLLGAVAETRAVAVPCSSTPNLPKDLIAATRSYFDGSTTLGAAPTRGLQTRLDSNDAAGTGWITTNRSTFDAYGRTLTATDAEGAKTTSAYLPATGQSPTQVTNTNALGHSSTTHLDPRRGLTTAVVDANGKRTDVTYDALGRTTALWSPGWSQAANPTKPSVKYAYSISRSKPNTVTTETLNHAGNYNTSYTFLDGLLRQRATQGPAVGAPSARIVSETLYDTHGRAWKTYSPYYADGVPAPELVVAGDNDVPAAARTEFDAAGRAVATVAMKYGDDTRRSRTVYDGAGQVTTLPPQGGTAQTVFTDVRGQTTELRAYTNSARTAYAGTRYVYDAAGNLAELTGPTGSTWTWEYDKRGNQTTTNDPEKGVSTAVFDRLDRSTSVTDARGVTLSTSYDELGRKTALHEGEQLRAEWEYDSIAKGMPTADTRWVGDQAYTTSIIGYNDRYQPTASTLTLPGGEAQLAGTYRWNYTYNAQTGLPISVQHPAIGGLPLERVVTAYNSFNLPHRTTTATAILVQNMLYDPLARPVRTEYGSLGKRIYQIHDYDEHTGQVTRTTLDGDVALRIEDTRYTYDDAGNLTRISATSGQDAAASTDTQCFAMDALRRLTDAWTTKSATDTCAGGPSTATVGGPDAYWHSYAYDLAGNRTTETRHGTTAGADSVTHTHTYGATGQPRPNSLRSVSTTGGAADGRTETFAYDDAGNTTSRQGGARNQSLDWNTEGQLESVTENGTSTEYLYDSSGNRLIARNADDTTTAYLTGGNELTLTAAGTIQGTRYYAHAGETVAVRKGSSVTFLFSDQQGTALIAVSMLAGQAVQRRKQLPFGGERGTATAWPTDKGFLGGTDDPTGLTHLGARNYDPDLGRFLSVDPLLKADDSQQINGYNYANNSPINLSDPTGLAPCEIFDKSGCPSRLDTCNVGPSWGHDRCYSGHTQYRGHRDGSVDNGSSVVKGGKVQSYSMAHMYIAGETQAYGSILQIYSQADQEISQAWQKQRKNEKDEIERKDKERGFRESLASAWRSAWDGDFSGALGDLGDAGSAAWNSTVEAVSDNWQQILIYSVAAVAVAACTAATAGVCAGAGGVLISTAIGATSGAAAYGVSEGEHTASGYARAAVMGGLGGGVGSAAGKLAMVGTTSGYHSISTMTSNVMRGNWPMTTGMYGQQVQNHFGFGTKYVNIMPRW
jgi:RHS repeat-associated protein